MSQERGRPTEMKTLVTVRRLLGARGVSQTLGQCEAFSDGSHTAVPRRRQQLRLMGT